jgi:hypothetical protein
MVVTKAWQPCGNDNRHSVAEDGREDKVGTVRRLYLVVHEMIHLIEPTHNARFAPLMDRVIRGYH